jgi:nicotinamidase-related amidase
MKTALLLIDIQNDYFEGHMRLANIEGAANKAKEALGLFRERHLPIFHIQHFSIRPNATFFLPGTLGVEIHDSVKPQNDEAIIKKNFPNSFRETGLQEALQQLQIENLVICGAMSHMCIDTTTRAAFDLGYKNIVISDACATKDLEFYDEKVPAQTVHAAYMAGLNSLFAQVMPLSGWQKTL